MIGLAYKLFIKPGDWIMFHPVVGDDGKLSILADICRGARHEPLFKTEVLVNPDFKGSLESLGNDISQVFTQRFANLSRSRAWG